jgi:hypothetical protein
VLTYVYFGTNDLERAIRFYDATLTPLRMHRCVTGDPDWDRASAGWGIYEDDGVRELVSPLCVAVLFCRRDYNCAASLTAASFAASAPCRPPTRTWKMFGPALNVT